MRTKYREVFAAIEKDILFGRYDDTRKLRTEDAYIEEYNVSRNTVRNAIDLLVKRGYCFPIQGCGVFLRHKRPAFCYDLENINGLTSNMAPLSVTNDILEFREIQADEKMAEKMEIPLGNPLYYVVRMRSVEQKPYVYEINYFNKLLMPKLDEHIAQSSIFIYLNKETRQPVSFMDLVIKAVKIDAKVAQALCLNEGDPGLYLEGFTMIRTGEVVQYYECICHYENARFFKLSSYY